MEKLEYQSRKQAYAPLILLIAIVIAMVYIAIPKAVYAQSDLTTENVMVLDADKKKVTNKDDMPEVSAAILEDFLFNMNDAEFSTTSDNIELRTDWQAVLTDDWDSSSRHVADVSKAIVYKGPLKWGSANTTKDADAKLKANSLGSYQLRWSNAVELKDSTLADLVVSVDDWTYYVGEKPKGLLSNKTMYVVGMANYHTGAELTTANPRTGVLTKNAVATTVATEATVTVKVMQHGTNTVIDASEYPDLLFGFRDLDVRDFTTASSKSDSKRFAGKFAEGTAFVSGFTGPLYLTTNTKIEIADLDGNQKAKNGTTENDTGTLDSGYIVKAAPSGFTFKWYGAAAASQATADDSDDFAGTHMATAFESYCKLVGESTVNVWYEWDGDHPNKPVPEGRYNLPNPTEYTVDTQYQVGDVVKEGGTTWTFKGWDKNGTITINEDTVIYGTWEKVTDEDTVVSVTYVWVGEHPNVDPPEKETALPVGTKYEVDTDFPGAVVTEDTTRWTCLGWDKSGTITLTKDVIIHGRWTKEDAVPVTYVWDGEHPDIDPPAGETVAVGSQHTVDTTFPGRVVEEDGVKWTCNDWDKSGILTINEPTIIHGTWTKEVQKVPVSYVWDGEHPNIDPPAGKSVDPRTQYIVDTDFPGKVVTEDGVTWTCNGWDQSGTITINEPTVLHGTWTKTEPEEMPVIYVWDGEHPNISPPAGETVAVGSQHTVDTTFPARVITEDGVRWTCDGWDQSGAITINEPTVIHGTWTKEDPVTVKYVWDGEHPNIDPPEGKTVAVGTQHTVDTVFPGRVVKEGNVTWTCNGWDQSGIITINKPTVIHGTWTKSTDVPVIYVWTGEHPDIAPPADELVAEGTKHTVDTTFPGKVVTEDGVKWTCNGWDQSGTITINEPTIIHGTWTKEEPVTVKYVWNGEHPNIDPPAGETVAVGTKHDVDAEFPGKVVREGNVTWTCNGWDQSGTITINEPTVIHGTWTKTTDVPVIYVWTGEHPNIDPPADELVEAGTKHTVDTEFPGKVVTENNVTWTCNGWDQSGIININEPTIIHGTWTKEKTYTITTEVVNGDITEDQTDIPPGENRTITYEPDDGYTLVSVTVDGEEQEPSEFPASYPFEDIQKDHHIKVVFEKIPKLAIEKTADKEVYNAGDTVTYTVTVKQTVEGMEAKNVTVTDTMPEEVTLNKDSFTGEGFTVVDAKDHSYELSIASLKTELTYTYTAVTAKDADADELINVVTASAENVPGGPVKDEANIKAKQPKPTISKQVSNETPAYGEEITYTISVKEPQDGISVRNAVVTDQIPEGIEYVADSVQTAGDDATASFEDRKIVVKIPNLETETVITFKVKVTKRSGSVDNIAVLTGDDIEPIQDDAKITVKDPQAIITKQASNETPAYGEEITYTITAKIPQGGKAVNNAVVTDQIPEGIEYVADSVKTEGDEATASFDEGKLVVSIPQLKEETTITFKAKVTKTSGSVDNIAVLTGEDIEPIQDNAEIIVGNPQAIITKSVSNEKPVYGEEITYTITAKIPQGGKVVNNAVVTDQIPEGIKYVADSVKTAGDEATASFEDKKLVVKIPQLENQTVITFKAKVTKTTGSVDNIAVLTGDDIDKVQDNAKITIKDPQPTLKKSVSPSSCKKGDIVTYTLTAYSDVLLTNVKIVDTPPKSVVIDESSVQSSDASMEYEVVDNVLTVKFEKLKGTVSITYEAEATRAGSFTNVAKLTAENLPKGPIEAKAKIKVAKVNKPDSDKSTTTKTTKSKSSGSSKSSSKGTAKTGDPMNIMLLLSIMAGAALIGAGIVAYSRRRRN